MLTIFDNNAKRGIRIAPIKFTNKKRPHKNNSPFVFREGGAKLGNRDSRKYSLIPAIQTYLNRFVVRGRFVGHTEEHDRLFEQIRNVPFEANIGGDATCGSYTFGKDHDPHISPACAIVALFTGRHTWRQRNFVIRSGCPISVDAYITHYYNAVTNTFGEVWRNLDSDATAMDILWPSLLSVN